VPFSIPCCRIPLIERSPAAEYLKMAQTTLINSFLCRLFHETAIPAHNNITVYYGEIEWLKSIIACFAFVI
jgi:hypothetical protein